MINSSLTTHALADYVTRLVALHFPDGVATTPIAPRDFQLAMDRLEYCVTRIHRKYFVDGGVAQFNHLNGDQFAVFLYYLANTVWRESGDDAMATRLFALNKILHGLDLYFAVEMPSVFRLVHPVGTVLGRASYGDYFVAYQNCAVGADEDGVYPSFGEGVILYARSAVLGNSRVGSNVVIAANAFILNTAVPDDSVVVGQYPGIRVLPNGNTVKQRHFDPVK